MYRLRRTKDNNWRAAEQMLRRLQEPAKNALHVKSGSPEACAQVSI
jgi:hypothetical protein